MCQFLHMGLLCQKIGMKFHMCVESVHRHIQACGIFNHRYILCKPGIYLREGTVMGTGCLHPALLENTIYGAVATRTTHTVCTVSQFSGWIIRRIQPTNSALSEDPDGQNEPTSPLQMRLINTADIRTVCRQREI